MSSRLLLRSNSHLRLPLPNSSFSLALILLRSYHVGKASSVNTAIARGLRKSKGIGFRGPRITSSDDPRVVYRKRNAIPAYDTITRSDYTDKSVSRNFRDTTKSNSDRWIGRGKDVNEGNRPRPVQGAPILRSEGFGNPQVFGRYGEKVTPRIRKLEYKETSRGNENSFKSLGSRFGNESGRDTRSYDRTSRLDYQSTSPAIASYPSVSARNRSSGSSQKRLTDTKSGSTSESRYSSSSDQPKDRFGSDREQSRLSRAPQSDRPARFGRDSSSAHPSDSFAPRSIPRDRGSTERPSKPFEPRSYPHDSNSTGSFPGRSDTTKSYKFGERNYRSNKSEYSRETVSSFGQRFPGKMEDRREMRPNKEDNKPETFVRSMNEDPRAVRDGTKSNRPRTDGQFEPTKVVSYTLDKNVPISIPYTTPASEFLYGYSVVEAAMSSQRTPRRKLYKLYIVKGENRLDENRDDRIKRLAQKNGIKVVSVGKESLPLLDKMSGGRPHNGFILEASPLPRLPITHLGEFKSENGQEGFSIAIDHQSKEEADVNGTSNFVRTTPSLPGRKPLVLLLDGVVDPGNMGGIIRTASFLGVSAIAVSVRNSASMTAVVLKASAGASENMTMFSVSKPAGFLVDSKKAGWKIYAAVAPNKDNFSSVPESLSTDDLDDPLSEAPCILMLGGEGEGIRWLLRAKADVDLYIKGGGQALNVDSLNVSVAAGILCNSFFAKKTGKSAMASVETSDEVVVEEDAPANENTLF
ncbi:uncharacterized protein RAG0_05524 [Rhynchosporium agropyri]|uniref:rRNA methyltransferase 1, mitochondrial n=1 Tax=Rhynchosporium agropyri TaxID=914238 RepID=A0A1E1KH35_9HELO|nr:uncharacterized protein RAG0_05524 [Rhynchosporium agropyri]